MIVVIDSSVWVSGFQFEGTPLRAIDHAFLKHEIAICRQILHETRLTLNEKFNWSQQRFDGIISIYMAHIILVEVSGEIRSVCRDPNDDMVLECAILSKAEVIVTGDKDLLTIGSYEGIRIMAPRDFLDEFAHTAQG